MHKLVGVALFQMRLYERSRRRFERVLEIKGDDFFAYVYLGRIAYNLGDRAGWRRECEHARRASPQRYAKLKHPFELFEPRAAGNISEEAGERATWRAISTSRVGSSWEDPYMDDSGFDEPSAADDGGQEFGLTGSESCLSGPTRLFGDDFSSEEERRRFRELKAIDSDDLRRVNLDELLRQLTA
jgi:hypothetical protein